MISLIRPPLQVSQLIALKHLLTSWWSYPFQVTTNYSIHYSNIRPRHLYPLRYCYHQTRRHRNRMNYVQANLFMVYKVVFVAGGSTSNKMLFSVGKFYFWSTIGGTHNMGKKTFLMLRVAICSLDIILSKNTIVRNCNIFLFLWLIGCFVCSNRRSTYKLHFKLLGRQTINPINPISRVVIYD